MILPSIFDKKIKVRPKKISGLSKKQLALGVGQRGVIYVPYEFVGMTARVTIGKKYNFIKEKPITKCKICGNPLPKGKRKYCSDECVSKVKERRCKICGKISFGFRCKECFGKKGTSLSRRKGVKKYDDQS